MKDLHFPSIIVVCTFLIIEIASIFNGDFISLLWFIRAVPRLQHFSGDTHDAILTVRIPAKKANIGGEGYYGRGYLQARAWGLEEGLEC